jgi:DNA-binding CsgD family transcriptional regulator
VVFRRPRSGGSVADVAAVTKTRARDRIAQLSAQGLDLVEFWRACTEPIATAIPHHWAPCFFTLDPASLLITSHFDEGIPELPAEWLRQEYLGDDVHQLVDIARSEEGVSTLHEVTGGDQEMITALRTRSGHVWGAMSLYRAPDEPMFDQSEKTFLQTVAPYLAEGARRGLLIGEAIDPEASDAPGLVVLDHALRVESTTPGIERWLADLPDGDMTKGKLPSCVKSVAASALRSTEQSDDEGQVAMARVVGRSGTWIVVHAAALVAPGSRRVAVIVEPAHPARISSLLMSVYELTEREKEVTRLVLHGSSTTEIADVLVISPHTVQQHFKSIFDKTGVRSRRDLVAKVFFAHYEPRVRDNERRALSSRPLRGGPVSRLP